MKKICYFLLAFLLLYGMTGCSQSNRIPALSEMVENGAEWSNKQLQQLQNCSLDNLEKAWGEADGEIPEESIYFWKVNDSIFVNVHYNDVEVESISISNQDKTTNPYDFGASSIIQQDDIPSQKAQFSVTHICSDNIFELSAEDSEIISQILDATNWISDSTKCDSDYTFVLGDRTIYYHSDCGTFNEKTSQEHLSLSLSGVEKEAVNSILQAGADDNQ